MPTVVEPLLLAPVEGPVIPGLPSVAGLARIFEELQLTPKGGFTFAPFAVVDGEVRWSACAIGAILAHRGIRPFHTSSFSGMVQEADIDIDIANGIADGFDNPGGMPAFFASMTPERQLGTAYGRAVAQATWLKELPGG